MNIDNQEITKELHKCKNNLLETILSFDNDQFNKIPFEGSWTAGQVTEHLLKSSGGVPGLLTGNTETPQRAADEQEPALRAIFLDFSRKAKAGAAILPGDGPHSREELHAKFKTVFEELIPLAETQDLSAICTAFAFPTLGNLSRFEWLVFVTYHVHRHTHQMKDILHKLTS